MILGMVKLTPTDVKHIAKLAQLTLTEAEITKFTSQLLETLTHVNKLNATETFGIEPTSQVNGKINTFRPDIIKPELTLPQNKYFKVAAILNKNQL